MPIEASAPASSSRVAQRIEVYWLPAMHDHCGNRVLTATPRRPPPARRRLARCRAAHQGEPDDAPPTMAGTESRNRSVTAAHRLVHPDGRRALEHITQHPQLGAVLPQLGQLGPLRLAQRLRPPSRRRRAEAHRLTSVPWLTPNSRAACDRFPVSSTSRTAPCLNSSSNFRCLLIAPPIVAMSHASRGNPTGSSTFRRSRWPRSRSICEGRILDPHAPTGLPAPTTDEG